MSDLRVTDVQAALRHFSNNAGHDVLSGDRHSVLLDNQKYGLAVGHLLSMHTYENTSRMSGRGDINTLSSFIHQEESPIISQVSSSHILSRDEDEEKPWVRSTAPLGPYHLLRPDHSGTYEHFSTSGVQHPEGPMRGMLYQVKKPDGWVSPKKVPFWESHKDIHEALAAHKRDPSGGMRPAYSQEELRNFNHPLALERLISGDRPGLEDGPKMAYQGLVHVYHNNNDDRVKPAHYMYDPDTEQLFKHEG
jgi:hypothetical protein